MVIRLSFFATLSESCYIAFFNCLLNDDRGNYKALTIVNCHVRDEYEKREAMERSMKLLAFGRLSLEGLVKDYSFIDINRAFQEVHLGKAGLFKGNLIYED